MQTWQRRRWQWRWQRWCGDDNKNDDNDDPDDPDDDDNDDPDDNDDDARGGGKFLCQVSLSQLLAQIWQLGHLPISAIFYKTLYQPLILHFTSILDSLHFTKKYTKR